MDNNIIVGIGEIVWDVIDDSYKLGGAPANFAYHSAVQGFESYIVSAVGNDKLGDKAIGQLVLRGCHVKAPVVDFPTGCVNVTKDQDGVPSYDICSPAAWDHIPFNDDISRLAARTAAVCFGTLAQRSEESRKTIMDFVDAVPEDSIKVFDVNLRQNYYDRQIIEESLKRCNILKVSDSELEELSRVLDLKTTSLYSISELSERYGISTVLVTSGARGSLVVTHQGFSALSSKSVDIVDTVGAGDSFTAAYVTSLLRGTDFREAHKKAVELSGFVCSCEGAMPVVPESLIC